MADLIVTDMASTEALLVRLEHALVTLDRVAALDILTEGGAGWSLALVERLVGPVLERIGAAWSAGTVSLSQVYMAGRLCEHLVETVLPGELAVPAQHPPIAIAVLEDYHLLGLRVVSSTLRASGFAVRNFGGCTVEALVERVRDEDIAILLVSVLMLPSALRVRDLVQRLRQAGLSTRVVVGGAPFRFDPSLAAEVGADAGGETAGDAVRLVRELLEVRP